MRARLKALSADLDLLAGPRTRGIFTRLVGDLPDQSARGGALQESRTFRDSGRAYFEKISSKNERISAHERRAAGSL